MVSTWAPRFCGIATYAEGLVGALRGLGADVQVVCHIDGGRSEEKGVHPVIDMTRMDWFAPLYQKVEELNPDVVHVQHEYGIYSPLQPDGTYFYGPDTSFALAEPLYRWKIGGRATVVTYHSVTSSVSPKEAIYLSHMIPLATANILHEPYQRENLPKNLGRPTPNVWVIPHGAPLVDTPVDRKKALGLEGHRVVGMMGWWEPNKGYHRVVEWWPQIKSRLGGDVFLVVAGDARPGSPGGLEYKPLLLKAIADCPDGDSVRIAQGAFDSETYRKIISSFDLIVLPYTRATQSGNLANAYALGVPAVVAAIEGLKSSLDDSGAGIAVPDRSQGFIEAIVRVMTNTYERAQFSARALVYVRDKIAWPLIALRHLEVYQWARESIKTR